MNFRVFLFVSFLIIGIYSGTADCDEKAPSDLAFYYMKTEVTKCCQKAFPNCVNQCVDLVDKEYKGIKLSERLLNEPSRQQQISGYVVTGCDQMMKIKCENMKVEEFSFFFSLTQLVSPGFFDALVKAFPLGSDDLKKAMSLGAEYFQDLQQTFPNACNEILSSGKIDYFKKLVIDDKFSTVFKQFFKWRQEDGNSSIRCGLWDLCTIFEEQKSR
ncbi:uncharacterized protein LOC142330679 [Lycorma delicatula]|uniref:uncharacterized protein LOC142330679 n=1 Tax=Lycorma delicatula TaxID=130591 RepID=UPI003F50D91E